MMGYTENHGGKRRDTENRKKTPCFSYFSVLPHLINGYTENHGGKRRTAEHTKNKLSDPLLTLWISV
jgi:hypothetical protein